MNNAALIVEDTPEIADVMAFALKTAGFETEIVLDGGAVMERLYDSNREVPTMMILDINLPHMNGREILQHIRSDARLENILVIVVTANPHMAETVEDQADIVLLKPVTPSQLRTIAQRLAQHT